jgi:hypothetical protein
MVNGQVGQLLSKGTKEDGFYANSANWRESVPASRIEHPASCPNFSL